MGLLKNRWPSILSTIVFTSLIVGCSTVTQVNRVGSSLPSYDQDCKVEVFNKSLMPPKYETIGKIETHIQRNIFFGGETHTNDDGTKELRRKVCALGGNGVVIDDSIETSAAEMRHVHIWARALKVSN